MKTKSLGFIGGGRITKIFLQAFKNKKINFNNIVVADSNPEITENLKQQFPFILISDANHAASQEYVFIALHPPVIMETLDKIAPFVSETSIVISLAPKVKIAGMADKLKNTRKFVRMIPNATSVINEGYNPVCFSSEVNKAEVMGTLQILGKTFEVEENKLEAYAIISAMAPTYFWFQWRKLASLGKEFGMDSDEAKKAVYNTLIAALNTLNSNFSEPEVLDLIPVKPISENEKEIENIFEQKLKGLYAKLTS